MRVQSDLTKNRRRNRTALILLTLSVIVLTIVCLFVGSSHMSIAECFTALAKKGSAAQVRIIWNIRIPRVLAAIIAGAGLSISGLIMQTDLNNPMASPSTLGVSNAAVFGANLSIIAFAGGFLDTGNHLSSYTVGTNPYATSLMAFLFSTVSILLILGLCRLRAFQPGVVVLAGIAIGSVWTAATTILQFYATDVGLSAAVIWTFGDLGRATYRTDCIMAVVVLAGLAFFTVMSWQFNALLSGDAAAKSMGVAGQITFHVHAAGLRHHGGVRVLPRHHRLCGHHLSTCDETPPGAGSPRLRPGLGFERERTAPAGRHPLPQYGQWLGSSGGRDHVPARRALLPCHHL